MSYTSPFQIFEEKWNNYSKRLSYSGTLGDVLYKLLKVLNKSEKLSIDDHLILAFYPPRVIRALLDYKIDSADDCVIEKLFRESISLCQEIYIGTEKAKEKTQDFINKIRDYNKKLLDIDILQSQDDMTWYATHPDLSRRSAKELKEKLRGKDMLLINLAHGSTPSAMDVYLFYCDITGSQNSILYPIRFSTNSNDNEPRLSKKELEYLLEIGADKPIVLFDEDFQTASHLIPAKIFLKENLKRKIMIAYNRLSPGWDNRRLQHLLDL